MYAGSALTALVLSDKNQSKVVDQVPLLMKSWKNPDTDEKVTTILAKVFLNLGANGKYGERRSIRRKYFLD